MTLGRLVARGLCAAMLLAALCVAGCATPSINNDGRGKASLKKAAARDSFPTAAQAGITSSASAE